MTHNAVSKAHTIALQETRHHHRDASWILRTAASFGWGAATSAPPPPDARVAVTKGGVAILWRRTINKATRVQRDSWGHRLVAVKVGSVLYASIYGPQAHPDLPWLDARLSELRTLSDAIVVVGDYNWRPSYGAILGSGWQAAAPLPTTAANSAPTRCLVFESMKADDATACPPSCTGCSFLPNVPFHGLVGFSCRHDVQWTPSTRIRRTARYEWKVFEIDGVKIQIDDDHELFRGLDMYKPRNDEAPLHERWAQLHARWETAYRLAEARGWAATTRRPERPKGSLPSERRCAPAARHRLSEPIALRRLRRLHRRASELVRQGFNMSDVLPPMAARPMDTAASEGLLDFPDLPTDRCIGWQPKNRLPTAATVRLNRCTGRFVPVLAGSI